MPVLLRRPWHYSALVWLLGSLLYAGSLDHGFAVDDQAAIRDNPVVHRGDFAEVWTSDYWAGYHSDRSGLYRPLTVWSFALQYRLAGPAPPTYHLVELLLHASTGLLLYALCQRLTRRDDLALLSGLLFASHPALSEAVAGLVGRADLMAALFGLLALHQHLRAREKRRRHLWAALALLAGLLSKESAIAVPALLLLSDLFQYRVFSEKCYWPAHLLYAGVALLYLGWRWQVLGGVAVPQIDPLDNPLVSLGQPLRLLNSLLVLFRYLGLLLLPVRLSADYSLAALPLAQHLWSVELFLVLAGLAGLAGLLVLAWRVLPWTCFGLGWLLLGLGPVANILLPIGTIMAERLLYLPGAGFAVAAAASLLTLGRGRAALAGLLLAALYSIRTVERVADWQDAYTLFNRVVEYYPGSARAWHYLGRAALGRGEQELGLAAFQRALQILPTYYEVDNDLGVFYFGRQDYTAALEAFRRCLEQRRDFPPAWLNLGLSHYHLGQREEATAAFGRALELDPRYVQAHYDLGVVLLEEGKAEEAAAHFRQILALEPGHPQARVNLEAATRLLERRRPPAAAATGQTAPRTP